ncbi:tautomerase family protein [Levilactobacillus enshiensis]|uniref:tautomerase family protein n=1 Tax=Levilactobacillus enshiensis TaxID=2590213 RepID=UPI00117A1AFA|nr:tautomerase family protein [Levilactobacillus enshiensis]
MPYLNVRLAAPESTTTAQQVAQLLTTLATDTLGKAHDVVAVDVQFAEPAHWFVGGQATADQDTATFYIEIKVTTGTNTRDEKARFIAKTFSGMQAILGPVNPASYVVVKNVDADDWGFGGKTQAYRYIAPQL